MALGLLYNYVVVITYSVFQGKFAQSVGPKEKHLYKQRERDWKPNKSIAS